MNLLKQEDRQVKSVNPDKLHKIVDTNYHENLLTTIYYSSKNLLNLRNLLRFCYFKINAIQECLYMHTTNDQLSTLGTYLKAKAFG